MFLNMLYNRLYCGFMIKSKQHYNPQTNEAKEKDKRGSVLELQINGDEKLIERLRNCDFVGVRLYMHLDNDKEREKNGDEQSNFEESILIFSPIGRDSYMKKGLLINLPSYRIHTYDNIERGGIAKDGGILLSFGVLSEMFGNTIFIIKVISQDIDEGHMETEEAKRLQKNVEVFGFLLTGITKNFAFDLTSIANNKLKNTESYLSSLEEMQGEEFPEITLDEMIN